MSDRVCAECGTSREYDPLTNDPYLIEVEPGLWMCDDCR